MKVAKKSLARKVQVYNVVDIADKNREKIKKLQIFDLSYFNGRRYFDNDGSENYLIFQPIYNTFIEPVGVTETSIA